MQAAKIRRYLKHGTLPQLRVFDAVSRHGNFTRAAEELHMAQPTVSIQIKKLTETVGMPLFEQIGKRVHLTSAGRQLGVACQDIFRALAGVEDAMSDLRGLKSGSLRIAASTTAKYLAPRLLSGFVRAHPAIEISLQIDCYEALLERIAENADDLYIVVTPPEGGHVVVQRILPNPLVVFAPTHHPLACQKQIPFERFAREPLLMRERGSGTRMSLERQFAKRGHEPVVCMQLGNDEAIKEAMLAGLGIAALHRHALGFEIDPGELTILDVEGFPIESYWNFVYPVGKQLPAAAQAFMEYVRANAQGAISAQHGATRH